MNSELREDVQKAAKESLHIINGYFLGDDTKEKRLTAALKVLGFGVKVEHMNQLKDHGDKSLALRLIQFLPKDDETRSAYLKLTNPQVAGLLEPRPTKKVGKK